jgi:hypothetical protein
MQANISPPFGIIKKREKKQNDKNKAYIQESTAANNFWTAQRRPVLWKKISEGGNNLTSFVQPYIDYAASYNLFNVVLFAGPFRVVIHYVVYHDGFMLHFWNLDIM